MYGSLCEGYGHFWLFLGKISEELSGETLRQGVVTPIDTVVTAATRVKKRSRGQRLFLATVKRSRTIFKLGKAVKMQFWMVNFLWPLTLGMVNDQVASVQM